jgi:hypothetical protein
VQKKEPHNQKNREEKKQCGAKKGKSRTKKIKRRKKRKKERKKESEKIQKCLYPLSLCAELHCCLIQLDSGRV